MVMIRRKTRWNVDKVEYLRRLGAKIREEEGMQTRKDIEEARKREEEAKD